MSRRANRCRAPPNRRACSNWCRPANRSSGSLAPGRRDSTLRFPIRVPVVRKGRLLFALTAVMEPDCVTPIIRSRLPETEEWTRAIVDPSLQIAARSRGGDQYVGRPVTSQGAELIRRPPDRPAAGTSLEGEAIYSALSRTHYGWTTSVSVPAGGSRRTGPRLDSRDRRRRRSAAAGRPVQRPVRLAPRRPRLRRRP